VIVVHSSAGVVGRIDAWARWLNDLGVATFVLDAFSGRGLVNISADQGKLGRLNMIADSYRALELLSRHARIDPQRIAIMGFSRGGNAALYASVKRFQRMHLAQGLGFAAYIAFYPSCNVTYIDGDDVADKPVRIFHGALDDFDPPAPCRPYIARLQKAGATCSTPSTPARTTSSTRPRSKYRSNSPSPRLCGAAVWKKPRAAGSSIARPSRPSPTKTRASSAAHARLQRERGPRSGEAVKAFLTATFRLQ